MFAQSLKAEISHEFPRGSHLSKAFFVDNLVFMYHTIVASEPMIVDCVNRTSGDLRKYFAFHLIEEQNHAVWLHEDLTDSGIDIDNPTLQFEAAQFAGAQYYLIRHAHPAAVFGYLLVLECFPMRPETVKELEGLHGLKLSCLYHHAEHDVSHWREVLEQIDKLPTSLLPLVRQNALCTVRGLSRAAARFGVR
jgi:hypothetical protein